MQLRWPVLLACLVVLAACRNSAMQRDEKQAAPGFLFQARPVNFKCGESRWPGKPMPPGTTAFLTVNPQPPYSYSRLDQLTLLRTKVPALTLATNSTSILDISIMGADKDQWDLQFCAQGAGDSETEARRFLSEVSMRQLGSLVTLGGGAGKMGPNGMVGGSGQLMATAPGDAPVTVHNSFGPIRVQDMSGPVRVAAAHARITILNTTGRVDANGEVVDYAGSQGNVMLNAGAEIDIKMTETRFKGRLAANASNAVSPHFSQASCREW